MKYYAQVDGQEFVIEVGQHNKISVNGQVYETDFCQMPGSGVTSLIIDNHSLEAVVEEKDGCWHVLIHGDLYEVKVEDERARRLANARGDLGTVEGDAVIRSPMPGVIVKIPVQEEQAVSKGDQIIILESMKMENELRAPRDGVVAHIRVAPGASVEKDQVLLVITD
ncbi:MAG: acetyl-CoA carboxylase biotin carboxyl carrier protein subunit [Candidatus Promineifilaceae bacterium]